MNRSSGQGELEPEAGRRTPLPSGSAACHRKKNHWHLCRASLYSAHGGEIIREINYFSV